MPTSKVLAILALLFVLISLVVPGYPWLLIAVVLLILIHLL